MICTVCPRGCKMEIDEKGNVTGNLCPRGKKYAIAEKTNPKRTITTTVYVKDLDKMVSVRSSAPLPKNKIFDYVKEIKKVSVKSSYKCGDVIIENIDNQNVDIIITGF